MQALIPLRNSGFRLDTSGVAGFFGGLGEEAIAAMSMVHIFEGRKWLGWFNSPGSFIVAKKYQQLASSRVSVKADDTLDIDPGTLLGPLDQSITGPQFVASQSGTIIENTGQTGRLFLEECQNIKDSREVKGRKTSPVAVTVANIRSASTWPVPLGKELTGATASPKKRTIILACIPIFSSLAACGASGYYGDWYCFSLILLGIISSGVSCYIIGCADFVFSRPVPTHGSPAGDGILSFQKDVVILLGDEAAVNSITKGRFILRFGRGLRYHAINMAALFLTAQSILQLLLIPQGQLFGQIMFLSSILVSWAYNYYVSNSVDTMGIQRQILVDRIIEIQSPGLQRYIFGTRTSMTVFVMLILNPRDPRNFLDSLLPNDTKVWRVWKESIVSMARKGTFDDEKRNLDGIEEPGEIKLLETLYGDAKTAFNEYQSHLGRSGLV